MRTVLARICFAGFAVITTSAAVACSSSSGGGNPTTSSDAGGDAGLHPPDTDAGVGSNCLKECQAIPDEAARKWCGTDKTTYGGCDWICAETPAGIGVYPGACEADGSPPVDRPPYAADGDRVCDWNKVAGGWIAVECAEDFTDIPSEGDAPIGGVGAARDGTPPAMMPGDVDHRARYGPIKSQGSAGTCTAFATTAAMEGAVAQATGQKIVLSEMHLWSRYHVASTSAAAKAARVGGIVSTDMATTQGFNYDAALAKQWEAGEATPDSSVVSALNAMGIFEVTSVDKIDPPAGETVPTIDQVQQAIFNGSDVFIGMFTSCKWNNPPGGVIDDYDMSGRGGHAVVLVGYRTINSQLYFIIRNSWGAGWADGGYAYMSAPTLHANIKYGWTMAVRPPSGPTTAPNCPMGQAGALDGTCRVLCGDGSLADPMGNCPMAGGSCMMGQVPDATNTCVTACKTGSDMGAGWKVDCTDKGCKWTIDDGANGCTNGPCEKFCPAPICDVTTTVNELMQTIWTCTTKNK